MDNDGGLVETPPTMSRVYSLRDTIVVEFQ